MGIKVTNLEDEIVLISLEGRLDSDAALKIDDKFVFATSTKKANVIVDLSEVSFIASMGLRTLVAGARNQANRGGKLVLLNPQEMVRKVIETTGLDPHLPIFNDIESAKLAFA